MKEGLSLLKDSSEEFLEPELDPELVRYEDDWQSPGSGSEASVSSGGGGSRCEYAEDDYELNIRQLLMAGIFIGIINRVVKCL